MVCGGGGTVKGVRLRMRKLRCGFANSESRSAASDIASDKQWSSICPLLLPEPHHRLSQVRSRNLNRIQSHSQALSQMWFLR